MHLLRIEPTSSLLVREAARNLEVVSQVVEMTLDLYRRKGFVPPWVGYLAEEDGRVVGGCGFAAPPRPERPRSPTSPSPGTRDAMSPPEWRPR